MEWNDISMISSISKIKQCLQLSKWAKSINDTLSSCSYRNKLSEEDLAEYSDQVKQAFSLENGSIQEIYSAKFYKIKDM